MESASRRPADPSPLEGELGSLPSEPTLSALIDQLQEDRLWLLRQLDSGSWPDWRLDLAALERELGQLLEQARERCGR